MASLIGTLYPPVIDTFMPAFIYTDAVRVYYSLPAYGDFSNINYLHITLIDQETNQNALENNAGIYIIKNPLQFYDKDKQQYYVDISPSLTKLQSFKCNQFYKVQLRFDCNINAIVPTGKNVSAFAVNEYVMNIDNQAYFSEWSTVCLIRPIYQPSLEIINFSDEYESQLIPDINKGILVISGQLWFRDVDGNIDTKEQLYSYQISILDKNDNILLSTDTLYTSHEFNNNNINVNLNLMNINLPNNIKQVLYLQIQYTTGNLYTNIVKLKFNLVPYIENISPFFENKDNIFKYILDNNNGYVKLISGFVNNENIKPEKNAFCYLMRASSEDNFDNWQIMFADYFSTFSEKYNFEESAQMLTEASTSISKTGLKTVKEASYSQLNGLKNYEIIDNTVQSMVWYKYCIQFLIPIDDSTTNYKLTKPYYYVNDENKQEAFPQFYDIFFARAGVQIPLKVNPNISNYKKVVSRTKIDTLGGKYPKFAENAIMNYRQYSISGTITAEMDEMKTFMKRSDFFTDTEIQNLYMEYLKKEKSPYLDLSNYTIDTIGYEYYEWLWERIFREKLYDWLNDGEPKLMRSLTEGNIIVMLTDISLTPNNQLSRLISDFSCTAYEIGDDITFEQLRNLGILEFPANTYSSNVIVQGGTTLTDINSIMVMQSPYTDFINGTYNAYVKNSLYNINQHEGISSLTELNFVDLIKQKIISDQGFGTEGINEDKSIEGFYLSNVKITFDSTSTDTFYLKDGIWSTVNSDGAIVMNGHLINVNDDIQIFTNQNVYNIPQDLSVTSLKFYGSNIEKFQVDCIANFIYGITEKENVTRFVENIIAQYNQVFIPGEWLDRKIKFENSYIDAAENTKTYLDSWNGLSIETLNPYDLFSVKDTANNIFTNFLTTNENGLCDISSLNGIKDIAYVGRLIPNNHFNYSNDLFSKDYIHSSEEIPNYVDKIQRWLISTNQEATFETAVGTDEINLDNIIDVFGNEKQYKLDNNIESYNFQWGNIYNNSEYDGTVDWVQGIEVNLDIYMNYSDYDTLHSPVPTYWKTFPLIDVGDIIVLNESSFIDISELEENNCIYNIGGNPYIKIDEKIYPVVLLTKDNVAIELSDFENIEILQAIIEKVIISIVEENGFLNYNGRLVKEKNK